MKFETHNTQIFRLLEEAVQLKEDSNIPCLVRYTEKGLVGEYNKKYFIGEEDNNPFVCYRLDSDGEVELPEVAIYRTYLPYYCFEIVGTLVDTHSAEWMIYQAMQGKKGIHPDITRPVHYDGECMTMDGDEKPIRVAPSLFISSYPNGWEIYETEQKFANVKEGDSIMCSDGRVRIVDKVGKKPDKRNGRLWFNLQVEDWGIRTFYFDGTLQVPERELRFTLEYVCEPEMQKPTYQVGDWVEYRGSFGIHIGRIDNVSPNGSKVHIHVSDAYGLGVDVSTLRKLAPSQVVITIGCLKGTVAPVSINGIHLWFHLVGVNRKTIATIRIESLDTSTRELVESLLEAMQEEK